LTALPEVQQMSDSALDGGAGIDVTDRGCAGQVLFRGNQRFGSNHIGHRTTGLFIRQQHGPFGIDNIGRFCHKMHTAEDYNIGIGFSSLLAQFQGIAGKSAISWTSGRW